ncbi:Y-family DNA polymerase [Candidatus Nomurabacteria bacterium]|nr:Y-family DNA polymerase [Candidatus Kaiserbacteria bacterium]MCB9815644.1 Y-family DNA polymerase [Candidatus Nomurabacteria bacterium]
MNPSLIGLLDCNNFFVSCERLFRPDLIGKPVVVLSSNDGCVVARSKEIKDMGIPMGVPYFQIKDILKKADAVTFSSHFSLYRDISKRVFSVMHKELGFIEQYSIDEAFFTVSSGAEEVAHNLKRVIEKQVGIPVSIGLAQTKTQAKYANSIAKKGTGVCALRLSDWQAIAKDIPLASIWGVGGKTELLYKKHGLETVADFIVLDQSRVASLFGLSGIRLQQELIGNPVFSVEHKVSTQQSILSSRSFSETATDLSVLADAVAYHVRHATANLRSLGLEAGKIRVSIRPSRHSDFMLRGGSKEAFMIAPTADSISLLRVANDLLKDLHEPGVPYKKVGVVLSLFSPVNQGQTTLFPDDTKVKHDTLMSLVDSLNTKIKKESVLLGSRLLSSAWQAKSEVCSPSYTTNWSEVVITKAQ